VSGWPGCPCFWTEDTGTAERWTRVIESFEGMERCAASPWGYHVGRTLIGVFPVVQHPSGGISGDFKLPPVRSKLWPKVCDFCGYRFTDAKTKYGDVSVLHRRVDNGELVTLRGPNGEGGKGPPGMLLHMDWHPGGIWKDRFGDGINLHAVCPSGVIWHVDGFAYPENGPSIPEAWNRTGDPRTPGSLSVTPSIIAGKQADPGTYHGHLTAGSFTAG
jgi:hypothetical protein